MKIKNLDYRQMRDRHELFAERRCAGPCAEVKAWRRREATVQ